MSTKLLPFQPIFCRVFPHNLKYTFRRQNFQRKLLFTRVKDPSSVLFCVSKFSTRPGRERMGTGSGPGPGLRAGSSKTLIEDEADLSDWVSGLSSNSFNKTPVYSDSENDEGGNVERREFRGRESSVRRSRDGGFGRDSEFSSRRGGAVGRSSGGYGLPRGRGGGRGTDRPFLERRESDKDFGRRDRGYDKSESFPRRRNSESDSFSGKYRGYDKNDNFPRIGENDSHGNVFSGRGRGRAGRGGSGGNRGEPFLGRRTSESGFDGSSSSGGGRGRDFSEFRRGGKFESRLEEKRKSIDGVLSRGNEGRKGEKWGERGVEMRNQDGRNRGSDRGMGMKRGEKVTGQRGLVVTDDENVEEEEKEEEGKAYMNFKELISSDEDENDDEDVAEEDETDDGEENDEGSDMLENVSVSSESTKSSAGQDDSYLSESRFDQCSISPLSLKAIKVAGYEKMTLVQEATLPLILKGKDVLAKAKTGTGKTVAFLLPAIEQVVKLPSSARDEKLPPILVLVICPTRELASQAAAEANKLLKYHPSIGVQVVIGGTRLALEQKRMQANPCQILVATPGRLRDHVENTATFATRLMGVKTLVLDEADHLLDMGFRKDIEKIIAAVPKQRQTLLFSATIPLEVRQISHIALKRDHEFINTVQEGSEDTHSQVRQTHLVAPLDKHFPLLYTMLKDHIADDVSYKILVFCTTAMVTKLVASLLGELNMNVREIHSRKPQSYRTRVSDEFRKSKGLILVTSDVSARGVDYPDVTLVVQMGVPSDRQQYIHRLGRTGRKGKEGQGILMLAPWEEFFLSNIKDLPISKASEPLVDPNTRKKIERALSNVEMKNKESAYQAWLGYYNSNRNIGRDKTRLVELANEFSKSMGLDNPPAIPKLVLGKMGLKNVPGLRSK